MGIDIAITILAISGTAASVAAGVYLRLLYINEKNSKMTIQEQSEWMNLIEEDFDTMERMLRTIQKSISDKPVKTQFKFIQPIKYLIIEATQDVCNRDDAFLNNPCDSDGVVI